MKLTAMVLAALAIITAGVARAEEKPPPATGSAAQGTAQGQAGVSANQEGAAATGSASGSANATAEDASASLAEGTEVNATLTQPVDAAKARPGDEVTARAAHDVRSGGQVVVPRGAKLFGHVTRAEPRGGGSSGGKSPSRLGIVFDRAVLKDGTTVALSGAVAAVGSAHTAGSTAGAAGDGAAGTVGRPTGGLAGGVGSAVGGLANVTAGTAGNTAGNASAAVTGSTTAAVRSTGAVGGFDVAGALQSGSRGVFGLRDYQLESAATGSAEGSVLSSAAHTVRLESGTQLLVVAGKQAAQPAKQPAREPKDSN